MLQRCGEGAEIWTGRQNKEDINGHKVVYMVTYTAPPGVPMSVCCRHSRNLDAVSIAPLAALHLFLITPIDGIQSPSSITPPPAKMPDHGTVFSLAVYQFQFQPLGRRFRQGSRKPTSMLFVYPSAPPDPVALHPQTGSPYVPRHSTLPTRCGARCLSVDVYLPESLRRHSRMERNVGAHGSLGPNHGTKQTQAHHENSAVAPSRDTEGTAPWQHKRPPNPTSPRGGKGETGLAAQGNNLQLVDLVLFVWFWF